jgi:hypothetical protein
MKWAGTATTSNDPSPASSCAQLAPIREWDAAGEVVGGGNFLGAARQ